MKKLKVRTMFKNYVGMVRFDTDDGFFQNIIQFFLKYQMWSNKGMWVKVILYRCDCSCVLIFRENY